MHLIVKSDWVKAGCQALPQVNVNDDIDTLTHSAQCETYVFQSDKKRKSASCSNVTQPLSDEDYLQQSCNTWGK